LMLRVRRRWLRPIVVHDHAGRWYAGARAMRARATEIRHEMPDPSPMLAQFELHFRRVLAQASAHADRVIVVRQPWFDKQYTKEEAAVMWHGGAGQAWRENVTTYYSFDVVSRLMAHLDQRAASIAEALDIEQVDLMPILERSLTTYYDGFHTTPAGANVIAGAVASAVDRAPAGNRSLPRVDLLAS
jgi:hypothetical protein